MTALELGPITEPLLEQCLRLDHLARAGDLERRQELAHAAAEGRMQVATAAGRAVGYSVMSAWFFGAPFLALVYVDAAARGRGVGGRLVADCEERHVGTRVFTSTNLSNAPMQRLLRRRGWAPCGMLHGLDEGDPEIFYSTRNDPNAPTFKSL